MTGGLYNPIPVATLLVCAGCSVYISVPMYKSIRKVVREPWKGFEDSLFYILALYVKKLLYYVGVNKQIIQFLLN